MLYGGRAQGDFLMGADPLELLGRYVGRKPTFPVAPWKGKGSGVYPVRKGIFQESPLKGP